MNPHDLCSLFLGEPPLYPEIAETAAKALQRSPDGRCQVLPCPDFGTPVGVG
ncbi:hypothetical protein STIAU_3444 [Stigmatella aurantiaca DW4/3-1]|uniref:Uncharacterized protein n=1 Tax=Stigmatella aurantiaca (strain DW4/3-1) TaxID=378806 RepID=Q092A6_STIAD|nr:hypothetical protein STIAU_3444 [Stigmatella aurantiaca DW4/3-1]